MDSIAKIALASQTFLAFLNFAFDCLPLGPFRDRLVQREMQQRDGLDAAAAWAAGDWDERELLAALAAALGPEPAVPGPAVGASALAASRPKKRKYDPNKARGEQLRELRRLRVEAADLQLKLRQLQAARDGRGPARRPATQSEPAADALPAVWEAISARQLERRLQAEQENRRLRQRHQAALKLAAGVQRLLDRRLAPRDVRPAAFAPRVAARVFEELAAGVELAYREVERVLETDCPVPAAVETREPLRREGASTELFDRRVLPFGVRATGEAWWRRWQTYRGQPWREDDADAVVAERCGMEMVDDKVSEAATFDVQQILRRHAEDHRVVIVWHAYIEPFMFGGKCVRGVHFLLKGYVLMKPHDRDARVAGKDGDGDSATRVLTCYNITPHFSDSKLQNDSKMDALKKFVVSATSANISTSNELVENMLVDQMFGTYDRDECVFG
ncbi:unnamed protein product [Phytophthora lilii]|uniref:Unnamed protein product n=1 Tax=Phytophthora lilii TaxID=2077276 RepID=A0A9W6TIH2_9STRA|nr:unnamed protein product [Phytophthora lilii]